MVNERNMWNNQYNTDNPNNRPPNPPNEIPSDESKIDANNEQSPTQLKVTTGGPPGDPDDGDNSSNGGSKRSFHRKQTPWEADSSDNINESSEDSSSSDESWADDLFNNSAMNNVDKESKNKRKRAKRKLLKKMRAQTADDERRQRWAHSVHKIYKKQIQYYVGNPTPNIDGIRQAKIPSPEPYDGTSDVEKFDAWLLSLLRWMVVSGYCGPSFDKYRVSLVGIYLTGKAIEWYNDEVAGIHRAKENWTFEETIIGLFNRCVQAATVHQATQRYEEVVYDPDKGVRDYYATLDRWAARMPQPPNQYSFRKRFLDGLPMDMVKKLIDNGAVPEYAGIQTIVKAVKRLEDNKVLQNYYVSSTKKPQNSSYYANRLKKEQKYSNAPSTSSKPIILNGKPYKAVHYKSSEKPAGSFKRMNAPPENKYNKQKVDSNKPVDNKKPNKSSAQLCYGCGKIGHYANDPKCERYGQPRLYSIQEEETENSSQPIALMNVQDHDIEEDVPPGAPIESDDESEGEWALEPYEDEYVGRMYNDEDEDMIEFFGQITMPEDNKNNVKELDLGPSIIVEEGFNEDIFQTIDPSDHPYRDDEVDTKTIQLNDDHFAAINNGNIQDPQKSILIKKSSRVMNRPDRGPIKDRKPMTASITIGGVKAFTLFDSGCTIEALSPSFARVANIKIHQLTNQHSLQLGTTGSKAKFNYGTIVKAEYGAVKDNVYFDIVNIDHTTLLLVRNSCESMEFN
ncbi:hypothetical protein C8R42DRAFT_724803 [Lentinula raphanica]|nr:hypothetical protein C8R42DRAFT_724803 [Lentinula raphanica]